ncbi:hypothetical protein DUI87_18052 [Hirundo rustica rustica]|uniref:Uncharacterized protein n=1 Tax=Hirundo rustica rustica TaxID=333673 RepID=A0A3M0JVL5_HIRRU|nr:hypothetical protein DUI87_18052 [Hirundo rustica rustica]
MQLVAVQDWGPSSSSSSSPHGAMRGNALNRIFLCEDVEFCGKGTSVSPWASAQRARGEEKQWICVRKKKREECKVRGASGEERENEERRGRGEERRGEERRGEERRGEERRGEERRGEERRGEERRGEERRGEERRGEERRGEERRGEERRGEERRGEERRGGRGRGRGEGEALPRSVGIFQEPCPRIPEGPPKSVAPSCTPQGANRPANRCKE